jgi:hypothetical protein
MGNNTVVLTEMQYQYLRTNALISNDETAYTNGDLIIVENVLTKDQRVLGTVQETFKGIHENNSPRKILKG